MSTPEVVSLRQRWRLGAQLGAGGMGRVFHAQSDTSAPAVVKLVPKQPGTDRELLFEHLEGVPNVIPILDSGDAGDYWALVMPLARQSLRDLLNGRATALTVPEAVAVLSDIAETLEGLAGRVVHRDLKPDNVLLYEGKWCLADFGIARYADAATAPETRKFAMTPGYAAPEQWAHERATGAADVYAFGVIAFELLSGVLPFTGTQPHEFREQHLHGVPPSLPDIPAPLAELITACLYKAPGARPTPATIRARLQRATQPVSDAARRLQEMSREVTEEQSREDARRSAAENAAQRRERLLRDATRSLPTILDQLARRVAELAPQSVVGNTPNFPFRLRSAELYASPLRGDIPEGLSIMGYSMPFEVIACARIGIKFPPRRSGYEGRAHSLWYCDAQEEGVFRWFETAFRYTMWSGMGSATNPFALDLNTESVTPLTPVSGGNCGIAWPFTAIDQGEQEAFIERWSGWFAEAAAGQLEHPTHIPERDPKGSWRSGSRKQ